jgi:hypothetical protein
MRPIANWCPQMLWYQCVYRRKQLNSSHSHQRLRLETRKRNRLRINTLSNVNLRLLHSYPLGMTCQPFSRCIAACLAIADPDLLDGAAISFALWGMRPLRRIHSEPEASHAGHSNTWTEDSRVLNGERVCGGSVAAARNLHVCSSAHSFACFAATPARSRSAMRSFHLSTSFAACRERCSARATAWMRCCADLSKGLPAE